jgi:hypothetical protein
VLVPNPLTPPEAVKLISDKMNAMLAIQARLHNPNLCLANFAAEHNSWYECKDDAYRAIRKLENDGYTVPKPIIGILEEGPDIIAVLAREVKNADIDKALECRRRALTDSLADLRKAVRTKGETLPPSREKAYRQYLDAVAKNPTQLNDETDRKVYDWLEEHAEGEALPVFGTWSKYLREARKHYQTNKHTARHGRETGKTVVRQDRI